MDIPTCWDLQLGRRELRGRTFLLGNKSAFSLSLPAACGNSDPLLHSHKWFGAYLYGRKFLEGQFVRASGRPLSRRNQTGFSMGLVTARREYEVDGIACAEEYFVPDGVQGFACTIWGEHAFTVEPEFDLRLFHVLNSNCDGHEVEVSERGALVSAPLPQGRYDDATESFLPDGSSTGGDRLYAAVEVAGDTAGCELLPTRHHSRRKVFRRDRRRRDLITELAGDADHAPLWKESSSRVFAPVRLHLDHGGTILYGFGASREEALQQVEDLRENFAHLVEKKANRAAVILEHARLETGSRAVDTAYAQVLTRLMDALVARNATAEDTVLDGRATMILAGNQYFHDSWKRDENIALGFLLSLGFYGLARQVIRDTWQLQDPVTGRLPQRIRAGEAPPYHSSDGTLWALLRLHQYWRYTGDRSLLDQKLPMVELFFQRSLDRLVGGLLPSGRTQQEDYLWETWMDTPHTPRDGFPVEIQMLWIAVLQRFRPLLADTDPALSYRMEDAEKQARQALTRFNVRGIPTDSLDADGVARDLITPNAYFCFGLGLDLDPEVERSMRDMGRRQLAGRQGIVTLAPDDWNRVFTPEFLADRRNVRGRRMRSVGKFNYHRGVEWNWLSRFFVEAELKYAEVDPAYRTYLRSQVEAVLRRGGVGGISELYDLSGTRGPDFQAWSMSNFLEAIHAFAGVRIDVPDRRIDFEPQLPSEWDHLSARKWYGEVPLNMQYERRGREHRLDVTFPLGTKPDAELSAAFVLSPRVQPERLELTLDGVPHVAVGAIEPIPGTDRVRFRVRFPAGTRVQLVLRTRRAARLAATA
jgi:glycogen debranching enzyme